MPVYKAIILNKEISVNYDEDQKEKLEEAINAINTELESYDNLNGKISDSKLLSFLAIKLKAELLDLKKNKISKEENISLNDQIYKLREKNELLNKENDLINIELDKLNNQVEIIINLIKKTYDD